MERSKRIVQEERRRPRPGNEKDITVQTLGGGVVFVISATADFPLQCFQRPKERLEVARLRAMLYVVGLGLGDEKDITVNGLEAVKKCERVYLEAYTSILACPRSASPSRARVYGRAAR